MLSASKPSWQQVTALVSLSASGTVTGFSFVPHSPADLMSPTSMPVRLMALERSVQPAASGDAALRSAIVNVANYYLRMAQGKTPAEMEAIIWQHDSIDGVDHGQSCAAFASLTLELAAHVVGQRSWVTGGTSYPWPLHKWADVRVDTNPDSPDIISVQQDAETHNRWHPLGDGYDPQPGDWVLFSGHVEVVTKYAGGMLYTIGGDSLPNFSVNAHQYSGPLAAQGVAGFVNNGSLASAATASAGEPASQSSQPKAAAGQGATGQAATGQPAANATSTTPSIPGAPADSSAQVTTSGSAAGPAIPGMSVPATSVSHDRRRTAHPHRRGHIHVSHGHRSAGQGASSATAGTGKTAAGNTATGKASTGKASAGNASAGNAASAKPSAGNTSGSATPAGPKASAGPAGQHAGHASTSEPTTSAGAASAAVPG